VQYLKHARSKIQKRDIQYKLFAKNSKSEQNKTTRKWMRDEITAVTSVY
jgi:hypothetical protein